MSRIYDLEPLVQEALIRNPNSRADNFILYVEVLKNFIDTNSSLKYVFLNHVELGIPSLESITRCRRKLQERDSSLRDNKATELRVKAEEEHRGYALGDKQIF